MFVYMYVLTPLVATKIKKKKLRKGKEKRGMTNKKEIFWRTLRNYFTPKSSKAASSMQMDVALNDLFLCGAALRAHKSSSSPFLLPLLSTISTSIVLPCVPLFLPCFDSLSFSSSSASFLFFYLSFSCGYLLLAELLPLFSTASGKKKR